MPEIETIMGSRNGGPTLSERAKAQTILRQTELSICETLIRTSPDMPAEEVRANRESIGRWSREWDNLISKLIGDGGGPAADPWARFDMERQAAQRPASAKVEIYRPGRRERTGREHKRPERQPVMSTATAQKPDLARYAADPMEFFQDVALIPDGPRFGDIMTAEQRDFLAMVSPCLLAIAARQRPPRRGMWCEAVKGWGKDALASLCILWLLLFARWNVLVQCGADDREQAGELRRAALDWIRANEWIGARVDVQAYRIVNSSTGAAAEILTSDASSSHGLRQTCLWSTKFRISQTNPLPKPCWITLRRCPMPMDCFALMPDACKRGSGGGVKYIAMILVGTL